MINATERLFARHEMTNRTQGLKRSTMIVIFDLIGEVVLIRQSVSITGWDIYCGEIKGFYDIVHN